MTSTPDNIGKLRTFIQDMTRLVDVAADDEQRMIGEGPCGQRCSNRLVTTDQQ